MLIFSRPDFYMPLAMARVFSTNPQKNFLEDRDDRELSVKARLKPGTTLWPTRESELAVLAQDFAREYPHLNRDRGAGGAHPVRHADPRRRRQLEVQRDLHRPGAGRAAGGLHQRRRDCC